MPEQKSNETKRIRLKADVKRIFEAAARNNPPAIGLGFDMIYASLQTMATQALSTKDPVFLVELHYMGVLTLTPEQLELAENDLKTRGKYS
jgi:hypothetical protein